MIDRTRLWLPSCFVFLFCLRPVSTTLSLRPSSSPQRYLSLPGCSNIAVQRLGYTQCCLEFNHGRASELFSVFANFTRKETWGHRAKLYRVRLTGWVRFRLGGYALLIAVVASFAHSLSWTLSLTIPCLAVFKHLAITSRLSTAISTHTIKHFGSRDTHAHVPTTSKPTHALCGSTTLPSDIKHETLTCQARCWPAINQR